MNLNTSSPTDRLLCPLRSAWFSYLLWFGLISASGFGSLSIWVLMSERSVAAPALVVAGERFESSPVIDAPTDKMIANATISSTFTPLPPVDDLLNPENHTAGSPKTDSPDFSPIDPPLFSAQPASAPAQTLLSPTSSFKLSEPFNAFEFDRDNLPEHQDQQALPAEITIESETESGVVAQAIPEEPSKQALEESLPPAESLEQPVEPTSQSASQLLGGPLIYTQQAIILEGDEFSARARLTGSYSINPNVMVGATLDLTTGEAFTDSQENSINLNELYVTVAPNFTPTLRFTVGLLDLTAYFDRNSFAKDSVTQFLNPVFQTNPALAAAGIGSRPALLVNWTPVDQLDVKVAAFSSDRDLGELALDGVAAEIGLRIEHLILRGTFSSNIDAGEDDGFREIFQYDRGNGNFGLKPGDREDAFGLNAEYFIPELNLGLFGRYGWYQNHSLDRGGETFSVGLNLLDLFLPDDRLGLGYGQQLSNSDVRDNDDKIPDVLELFYDARILPFLRAGVSLQSQNQFSETVFGFRLRADFDLTGPRGILR